MALINEEIVAVMASENIEVQLTLTKCTYFSWKVGLLA